MTLKFDRKYVYLLFFAGFSLLLILFAILPLFQKIKDSSRQLIQKKEQKIYFSLEKENLQESKIIYEEITPDLKKTEDNFLIGKAPVELEIIKFLEKSASDFNVSIKISSVGSENKRENQLSFLALNLEASGSFNDFLKFLEKIENDYYLIEITSLIINKSTSNEFAGENIIASISLNVFKR